MELYQEYPWPSLELVPLATEDSLKEFIEKYSVLKKVEIQILDTNNEIDNADFFAKMRKQKESIGSHKTTLRHSAPEGLDNIYHTVMTSLRWEAECPDSESGEPK